jgi:tRNA (guanine10-N2)-methyltransferase
VCTPSLFRLDTILNLELDRGDQPYIPPTKPYELSQLVTDLVLFARYLLKPGGRLVFFLPTVTDEYEEIDIHTMLCEGMEVISNSLQDFGSWGRRVSIFQVHSLFYFYKIHS